VEIRICSLEEILPLRQAVIIAGTGRDSPHFPQDDAPSTRHIGVFEGNTCIGCATFMRSEWEGEPAWQLRGMATAPEWQRMGIGRSVLAFAESTLCGESGVRVMWCNARESAVAFYERTGWTVLSERFLVTGVGWHHRMVCRAK